jgi:SOS response regulatory protein OraA/RecX
LPAHVIEENNVEGFNSHEENCLKYFRTIMEDENKIASDERNLNKKLVKRGFQQPEISQYIKDVSSDNYNTNKHRMIRIMFLVIK